MLNSTDAEITAAAEALAALPERLRQYAGLLRAHGFTVYLPGGRWKFFHYSREVEGKTLVGYVQEGYFGEIDHSMPIFPSVKNGSSMFVEGVIPNDLSVAAAEKVTQPTNRNHIVGEQRNYGAKDLSRFIALAPLH